MQSEQNPVAEGRGLITVVLVDDEPLIRSALAQALSVGELDLVGEAADAQAAIRMVLDLRPDVVLMDLRLPGISGVEAIEQLGLLAPASRILVLTRSEQNRVVEAIVAGANGYILKSAPPEAIAAAVKATAAKQPSKPSAAASPNCRFESSTAASPRPGASDLVGVARIHRAGVNRPEGALERVDGQLARAGE